MAVFILETEAASSAASSISSLATEVANISSSVSGYDTSCEDGFNFAGAKSVIAGNLEACSTKISNTAKVIETVVSQHTDLQNKLKFQDPGQAGTDTTGTDTGGNNTGTDTGGNNTGSDTGGNNNYDGGSYYPSGGGGDGGGTSVPEPTPTEEVIVDKRGEVKTKLDKIGYAYADDENLSEETKKLLKDAQFKYDENGYAMIGNRYVITCDSSIANVGDVLRFQQSDGKYVDCVVGVTTVSEKYKSTINFIVDKNATGIKVTDVTKNLLTDSTKIVNVGSLTDVRKEDLIQMMQQASSTTTTVAATGTEATTGVSTTVEGATATGVTTAVEGATTTTGTTTTTTDGTTTIVTPADGGTNNTSPLGDASDKDLVQV